MARIVDHAQLTCHPTLGQVPGGLKRAADVVASMDENAGYAIQYCSVENQLVLREKTSVTPVVRDQPGEAESKFRIIET